MKNTAAWTAFCCLVVLGESAIAQMGGGGGMAGGGGGQAGVPMFDEPKFRDRVYENGGPQIVDSKSGRMITSVEIEGNRSVSEHKILSHMQSRVDRLYDRDTFNRDIGELYRTGLFDEIKPYFSEDAEGVRIRLVVRERPTVDRLPFTAIRLSTISNLPSTAASTKATRPVRAPSMRRGIVLSNTTKIKASTTPT